MFALFLAFATAFAITYLIIPLIIRVANERRILDHPNERSAHAEPTPSLGGIGIFAGTICAIFLWTPLERFGLLQYILAAFALIFLLGVLDDLMPISPIKKFGGQLLVAIILCAKANTRITSGYGIFGMEELSLPFSFVVSILFIIGIINAFNLIDGINGLAGSIGLFACGILGTWFFVMGDLELSVVSYSLAGAIAAFLRYNFTPAKIFMGDTGSLLIGTVCAILSIHFIESSHNALHQHPFALGGAPAVALAILILPVFDTLSSFARRIFQGKSPFAPDKSHVHHQMLALGLNHSQATFVLMSINLVFVLVALLFNHLGTKILLLLETGMAVLLALTLKYLRRHPTGL